jgi:hypothetical protein
MEEGPKITLPEDELIINALEKKLGEYEGRLKPFEYVHPEEARKNSHYIDALYKSIILKKLFEAGSVGTFELAEDIAKNQGFFYEDKYNNAAGVIDDYCKTGGKNTSKGSF